MVIDKLDNSQKEQAKEVFLNYKFAYVCSKCNIIYGSDSLDNTKLCIRCLALEGKNKGERFRK